MNERKTAGISARVEPSRVKRIDKVGKKLGLTRSDVVARCVALALPEYEKMARMVGSKPGRVVLEALHTLTLDKSERAALREFLERVDSMKDETNKGLVPA